MPSFFFALAFAGVTVDGNVFQVALYARMRSRRMSAFGGPCVRLIVEYLPPWFESHHSAVSSFFFALAFSGLTADGKVFQVALYARMRTRRMSAFNGPCVG